MSLPENSNAPPNLKRINGLAFSDCSLRVIDIPASVEVINGRAFQGTPLQALILRSVTPRIRMRNGNGRAFLYPLSMYRTRVWKHIRQRAAGVCMQDGYAPSHNTKARAVYTT